MEECKKEEEEEEEEVRLQATRHQGVPFHLSGERGLICVRFATPPCPSHATT